MAENQYKIELGIDLNDSQLNTVKKVLESIEEQKREVIYNVDFNIKNVDKLTKVGQEIDDIKVKLKELDDIGSLGKGKTPISIDSKSLENSLNKIHDSIKKLQNAFGRVDNNKGVQSLLTTVNKIRKSLEGVTTQFESLNQNLSALSSKDFSLNFDFGFGKSGAQSPEQAMQELKMLKKEIEEYQKYFSKMYSLEGTNNDPINRLMLEHNQRNQIYMFQLQQSMHKGSDAQRIAAAKEYIKVIKDTAKAANIALEPVEFKLAESSEFIRVRNEASETEKQLKELFSGGIDVAKLHQDLTNIAEDLRKIQEFISSVSKDNHIDGLTQSFNKLSETLERLSSNLVLTKDKIDTMSAGASGGAVSSAASDIASATDKMEKESADSANAVVQSEEKKQQALEQTANAYDSVARKSAQFNMSDAFKEVDLKVEATEEQISNLKVALHNLGFDRSSIDAIIKSFDELEVSVQKITTRLNDNGSATLTVKGVDQYGQNISASKSVHKRLDSETTEISDWSVTVTKEFKETEESFKRLKSLAKEMSDFDIKIASLEASGDIDGANSLKRVLNDLEAEYKELYSVTEKNLSTDQIRELEHVFANTTGAVREFKNELAKSAETKELTSGLERLKSITKEINSLKIDIFKFEDADNIERASNQLNELENEAAALRAELQQKFNITSFDEIDDIARKGEETLNNLVVKVAEAKAKLSNDIVLDIKAGSFDDDISKIDDKLDRLSGASKELRDSIQSVKNAYQEMENAAGMGKDGDGVVDVERLIRANKEYEQALEKVNNQLRIQAREEKAAADAQKLVDDRQVFQSKIDNWLTQNSAATKKFGASMTDLRAKAESCDRVTLNHLEKQFKKLDNAAENAGLKAQSFVDRIKSKFKEYAAYLSAAEVFMYAEQALRSMFEQVKLVDSAMTELKKVTNETDAAYSNFLSNASSRAKEIGTTIDGLVSSTADFARLGYNMSDAANLAEVANIYAVVGDDIDSVETATASLISTMTAFGEEASNSMSIVDKFNAVGKLIA